MKAIHIRKTGPPDSLEVVDIPVPVPGENEILVRVHAAGVNFADILARQGLYFDAPGMPFVPGYEVAGIVEKTGGSIRDFQVGQRIIGLTDFGGYAEFAVCPSEFVRSLDDPFSFAEGASIPVNWLTAYHCLYGTGLLQKGDCVLVHAAAGGVGTAAVQLLKRAGCIVIGTAGSQEKIDFLKTLGIDMTIQYRTEDFSERIINEFGNNSISIILDSVGGKFIKKGWKLLRTNGRIVSLGVASFSGKSKIAIGWNIFRHFKASILHLLGNSHGIYGVNMRKIFALRPDLVSRAFDEIMELFNSGAVKPIIDSTYPLDNPSEAHSRLESRKSIGKVVLTIEH